MPARSSRKGSSGRRTRAVDIRPLLVLIADDDPDARDIYSHYLRRAGMSVETATNGLDAVNKAIVLQPDVVVMDMSMPVLEGDSATTLLKTNPVTKHIPVLTMTAFGSLARSKARRSGADAFYVKPFLPEDLAAAVSELASRARLNAKASRMSAARQQGSAARRKPAGASARRARGRGRRVDG
jgi:CheY-like chemotaxis protein